MRAISGAAPTTMPACGPPSSLSPENATSPTPSEIGFLHRSLVRGAELLKLDERAAAEIFEHRHAGTASELREARAARRRA